MDFNWMRIDFKDVDGVDIVGFTISDTYEGHLEGSKQSITMQILLKHKAEKGIFYISPELVDGALKRYVFILSTSYKWEYKLNIIWYDDCIPSDASFINYLQQKVKDIEFESNCDFIDLDCLI